MKNGCLLSDHNRIKVEIDNRKSWRNPKYLETWEKKNPLLNNMWIKEEISSTIKTILNKIKMQLIKNLWNVVKAMLGSKFRILYVYTHVCVCVCLLNQ